MNNVAFLELKYGNIYGGYPNFFVISEVSLLVFEPQSQKIFIESLSLTPYADVVFVNAKVNDLGHTIGRLKHVMNLKTRKKQVYREEFRLDEEEINYAIGGTKFIRKIIKGFFMKNMRKYRIRDIVTFDGKRDLFLLEKIGVDLTRCRNFDLQKALNKACNYLFSLNKLAVAVNFEVTPSSLRSNNQDYYLHPIAARQIRPKSAAYDAARMFMAYQEYNENQADFLVKAQLLLNKIQQRLAAEEANKPKEEKKPAPVKKKVVAPPTEEVAAPATKEVAVATTEETAAPAEEVAAAKEEAPVATAVATDDLTKIEGIGPKIAETLQAADISTYAQLADAEVDKLKEVLTAASLGRFEPTTWPAQAKMAADGEWEKLKTWQDELDGGKVVAKSEEE